MSIIYIISVQGGLLRLIYVYMALSAILGIPCPHPEVLWGKP